MATPTSGEKLTYRQRKFCENYVISHDAKAAALQAGYSPRSAKSTGSENLTKPDLKKYIAELEGKAVKRATETAILTKAEILQMFAQFAKEEKCRKRANFAKGRSGFAKRVILKKIAPKRATDTTKKTEGKMRKFLKLLFSRLTLFLLAILVQTAFFLVVIFLLSDHLQIAAVFSAAVAFVTMLAIVNRDMSDEAKLPWCLLVAVWPFVGVVLYIFFSRNYASVRERKTFAKLPQQRLASAVETTPKYDGQLTYLRNMGAPCFADTETTYFGCGEDFFCDLLRQLEKAEKFVFLEYFVVSHGQMLDSVLEVLLRKVQQGVEVRLLYDDFGSLLYVKRSFCKKLNRQGIRCARFARLKPLVSAVCNNRDHRKIAVIDGSVGYLGGMNLSDEYINKTHPFGYWKDNAVKLCGNAVASLCTMFLQMFDMATNTVESYAHYLPKCSQKSPCHCGVVAPFCDGPRPLFNEQIAKNVYLNIVNQAEKNLAITTPYLIVDNGFCDALRRAAQRGVDVKIFIPALPDKKTVYAMTKQTCKKLILAGVKIYKFSDGFIHAKSIAADDAVGVVGTINLDYRSFVHHYECGVFMYQTAALHDLCADLSALVPRCEIQQTPFKLRLWEKVACLVAQILRPLM